MSLEQLKKRPSAPRTPPIEELENDDQIITQRNHPVSKFNSYVKFNPSFIGKTWGEMKKREANRETSFFASQDLDENLKILYKSLERPYTHSHRCYDSCLSTWRSTPNLTLDLSKVENDLTETTRLPSDARSVILNNFISQSTLVQNNTLLAMKIESKHLPVMPHIQVLEWVPSHDYDSICDFSGWSSLRILVIRLFRRDFSKIKLPAGLISFSYINYFNMRNETFENIFENDKHNSNIFQELKHLNLKGVRWPTLPILSNCISLDIQKCNNLKIIEAPKCQVLSVERCSEFIGFGPITMKNNHHLEKVILSNYYSHESQTKNIFHFPPGSPSGYKNIDICRYPVFSLPTHFDPFAYISIFDSGKHLFINNKQTLYNLEFYFNHFVMFLTDKDKLKKHLPKPNESLKDMIERMYGFNWPKFITKVQRQYRFKKFIKHEHKELISILPESISKYDIGKLLGATQTFKTFNKTLLDKKEQIPSFISHIFKRMRTC